MRAIYQSAYGSVDGLSLRDVPAPRPLADEVLVRVHAASLHPDVWHVVSGLPRILRLMGSGLRRPKFQVPGTDLAGVVEAVGADVSRFRPGDQVFGETLRTMQWINGQTLAEFACAPERGLAHKPACISMDEAACLPTAGLIASLNMRHMGRMKPGSKLLVNGAAGGVGSLAVQMALADGCRVTAVDSAEHGDYLRGLGAHAVLDYRTTDFTTLDERFDLVLDVPGNHSLREVRRVLSADGIWVIVGHDNYGRGMHRNFGVIPRMFGLMFLAEFDRHLPRPSMKMPDKAAEMEYLRALAESGRLRPRIDTAYPLADFHTAFTRLVNGRTAGRLVLKP